MNFMSKAGELIRWLIWRTLQLKFFGKIRPRVCHIPSFLIEGETKKGRSNLSIIVFARREIVEYFSKQLFTGNLKIRFLGRKAFREIPKLIASNSPDIAIANASDSFSEFFSSNLFFVAPLVDFTLDVSDQWENILARMSRSKRKRIRKIQGLGYTFEITNDRERLKSFYKEMYVPRVLKRHEKAARVVSFAECERLFQSGGLLLVKTKDGACISGAIYVPHGDELYIPVLGISEVEQYLTEGGHTALHSLILWAKQQGFKVIDYSISKPFLSDGIFCYKREWGMKIKPYRGRDAEIYAIKFCNFNEGSRSFLSDNPFIVASNGNDLRGLVLPDSNIKDLRETYYTPGLSGLIVLFPSHDAPSIRYDQLKKPNLKSDSSKISPSLKSFINLTFKSGYETYFFDF
ncbi:MAG: hypothetical protein QXY73_03960 [Candidatus Bathyarchaeia archaeon]